MPGWSERGNGIPRLGRRWPGGDPWPSGPIRALYWTMVAWRHPSGPRGQSRASDSARDEPAPPWTVRREDSDLIRWLLSASGPHSAQVRALSRGRSMNFFWSE